MPRRGLSARCAAQQRTGQAQAQAARHARPPPRCGVSQRVVRSHEHVAAKAALSEALQTTLEFSAEVWKSFGVNELFTDHYVKSKDGNRHFKPKGYEKDGEFKYVDDGHSGRSSDMGGAGDGKRVIGLSQNKSFSERSFFNLGYASFFSSSNESVFAKMAP